MARRKRLTGSRDVRGNPEPEKATECEPRQSRLATWAGQLDANLLPRGTVGRTQRLIIAAVRVWELKRGLRE